MAAPDGQLEFDLVRFAAGDVSLDLALDTAGETFWATVPEIASLFRTPAATVARQVAAIYAEGELDRADTVRAMAPLRAEGGRAGPAVDHYNLDLIIAVGYRVSSAKATAFRRWAGRTLRGLMLDGFVLDEARLRADGRASGSLAARLRAIRADESNIYETVRAFFAAGATDYRAEDDACRTFTRGLEDRFVFAVTGQTSPGLILARADHDAADMGLKTFTGALPSMDEARIAQNYLDADELYRLHVLCEQFLLLVQQKALRGQRMTMAALGRALDDLLRLDDYPVLPAHKGQHEARAVRHAQAEYARFILRAGARKQVSG